MTPKFFVVQRTGFCTYYLYTWHDGQESWLAHRELAHGFSQRKEADRVIATLTARYPGAVIRPHVEAA